MPKELSEDEMSNESDVGDIQASADAQAEDQVNGELKDEVNTKGTANAKIHVGEAEADEEDDDAEPDEGEYIVEAIRKHKNFRGTIKYQVKWEGWPEEDNTYEPEENLADAKDLLAAYHDKIGGRPESKTPGKRKSAASQPQGSNKKTRNGTAEEGDWFPSEENWEPHILKVDTVERNQATRQLTAFIIFKTPKGEKQVKVSMDKVYKHCPVAMLRFYEEHLSV